MKKILLLVSIVCSASAIAQTTPNNSGIKYYNYGTDSNPQTVISPTPGVYIQTPWWADSVAKTAAEAKNTKKTMSNSADSAVNMPVNNMNQPLPTSNKPNVSATVVQQRPGQIPGSNNDVVTNDISVWNKTTQTDVEKRAQDQLTQQYIEFLNKK